MIVKCKVKDLKEKIAMSYLLETRIDNPERINEILKTFVYKEEKEKC